MAPIFSAHFYDPGMKYILIGEANSNTITMYNMQTNSSSSNNYGAPFNLYSKYLINGKKLVLVHENSFQVWVNDWLPLNNFYEQYVCANCTFAETCSNITWLCEATTINGTNNTNNINSTNNQ